MANRSRPPDRSPACPQANRLFQRLAILEKIWDPIFAAAGLTFVLKKHLIRPARSPFCLWQCLRTYPTSFSKATHDGSVCKVISRTRCGLAIPDTKAFAFVWQPS